MVSGCSMQNNFSGPKMSKKEITKTLNDGCTIQRNKRERYKIDGKRYRTLSSSKGYKKRGVASWYGSQFDGKATACGERYDMYKYTAAHKTLPLPSYVNVKNLTNGKSVIVKINDRGPFVDNRIIDLSYAAAKKIDMLSAGTAVVRVTTVSEEEAAQSIKKNNQSIFSTNIFEKIVSSNHILFQSSKNKYRLTTDLSPSQIADEHEFLLNKRVHFYLTNKTISGAKQVMIQRVPLGKPASFSNMKPIPFTIPLAKHNRIAIYVLYC